MTYARCWEGCWSVVAATGLGFAILQMPGTSLFAVALLGSTAAAVMLASTRREPPEGGRSRVAGTAGVGIRAVGWGALFVATYTVIDDSPPIALLLALVSVTTCPPAVRLYRAIVRLDRARGGSAGADGDEAVAAHAGSTLDDATRMTLDDATRMVRHLSEADLCGLWRSTFWELHRQHTSEERLILVSLRQICLDELGRRNPEGVRAWLSSGARANSSPDRFLHPPHPGTHHAA